VSADTLPPWAAPAEDVVAALGSTRASGLTGVEAARRLDTDGPNDLASTPPTPLWRRVLSSVADPLVILLFVAIGISGAAWILEGAHGAPIDVIVIAAVIVLNTALSIVQENRADAAVAALSEMTQATSMVLRDGRRAQVPASGLVVGDILVLGEGDQVGADARLLEADALRVVESSLTGESEPVSKTTAPTAPDAELGDRTNMVFRGTAVAQGSGLAVVTATGGNTEMGAIAELLGSVEEEPTPLQREITQVSKVLGIAVVAIAAVVVATLLLLGGADTVQDVTETLLLGVSLAVAAVPEGLPAILSVVLALGVQRMAARNAVVKKLTSVETLGSATVICSDKTGTLTRSEMTIQQVVTASGDTVVTGVGYAPEGVVGPDADADRVPDAQELEGALKDEVTVVLSGGVLASDAELAQDEDGAWHVLGDPTEGSFLVAERKLGTEGSREGRFTRIGVIPFTSERKLMSVLYGDADHDTTVMLTKGAPDVLLSRCSEVRRDGRPISLDEGGRWHFRDAVNSMSSRALRTLGVAYRSLTEEQTRAALEGSAEQREKALRALEGEGLTLAGVVGIIDPARPEAADAVSEAHRAGVRVMMITGDHPATAGRIAADLGISPEASRVVTGAELSAMDDEELSRTVTEVNVYARVAPAHKMRIVDALQSRGETVAMTGDGVNDAPALRAADIGVAMGVSGTQVTKEAGTMVLTDDNFATIVAAVREGRRIFDNIRKFLRYLLSSNMGEVLTVFLGVVLAGVIGLQGEEGSGVIVPLLATQILWINLITDTGPALAMGVDPSVEDVMARSPRRRDQRVIDGAMWQGVLLVGLVMAVAALLTLDVFLPGGLVEGRDSLEVARTGAFTTLVMAQLFNTLNARSEEVSAFRHLFVNPWLWGALGLGVVLQVAVVEVPFLQAGFGTASLDWRHWAVAVALSSAVLWVGELRKILRRALGRPRS
jgi:magnesium-transporting ATPase (P-type)